MRVRVDLVATVITMASVVSGTVYFTEPSASSSMETYTTWILAPKAIESLTLEGEGTLYTDVVVSVSPAVIVAGVVY